jgi:hypothetical protein
MSNILVFLKLIQPNVKTIKTYYLELSFLLEEKSIAGIQYYSPKLVEIFLHSRLAAVGSSPERDLFGLLYVRKLSNHFTELRCPFVPETIHGRTGSSSTR